MIAEMEQSIRQFARIVQQEYPVADGKVTIPYARFLGFQKGADGLPEIIPEEAEIVRSIFSSFMQGLTPGIIVKMLMENGIPAPGGGDKWYTHTIKSILTNEKYKGAALLQKKYTVDFLTTKQKVNEGEVCNTMLRRVTLRSLTQKNLILCRLKLNGGRG